MQLEHIIERIRDARIQAAGIKRLQRSMAGRRRLEHLGRITSGREGITLKTGTSGGRPQRAPDGIIWGTKVMMVLEWNANGDMRRGQRE